VSTTTAALDLRDLAQSYLAGGVSIVPCGADTKQPDCNLLPRDEEGKARWKPYQTEPATAATVEEWFRRGCESVAAVGGRVSGGLLIIDFDAVRFFDAWKAQVGSLAEGLPLQRTGREGGGYQVYLRCPDPGHNDKLAWVPDETEETGRKCAIETRAEGGYAIMPGSLHPSGRRYQAIAGDFSNIPTVPQAVADALIAAARKLDEAPLTRQQMEAKQKAAKTSEKNRAESNGHGSIIDAFNGSTTIDQELEARGYTRHGDRWKRPGGRSLSVYVNEGRSFHHSSNDPLNDGYWHRPFDVFCALDHGGDCRAAVKAAAELLGLESRQPRQAPGEPEVPAGKPKERPAFTRLLTGAALLALDLRPRFLVRGVLVDGQPMIVGGRSKVLKTSIAVDLAISLGSGTPFLGRFEAERVGVGFWSGESGAATIRETAKRIAQSKGVNLADVDVSWCFELPRLSALDHLDYLAETIRAEGLRVVILDPLYLALLSPETASGASNVFLMGSMLQGLTRLGQQTGCTIILLHHFRKGGQPDDENPAGLEELAQSGVAEWARQWLLLQRRTPYQADGVHHLWLRCGGSAGHSSLWGVTIDEGMIDPDTFEGRTWGVTVNPAGDARAEAQRDKENRKAAEQERREGEHRERLLTALRCCPDGDTAKGLREASGLNSSAFGKAITCLLQEGRAKPHQITKNGAKYDGFRATGK
jgi:replicative DNA helicase